MSPIGLGQRHAPFSSTGSRTAAATPLSLCDDKKTSASERYTAPARCARHECVGEAACWAQAEGAISAARSEQIARHVKRALGRTDARLAAWSGDISDKPSLGR